MRIVLLLPLTACSQVTSGDPQKAAVPQKSDDRGALPAPDTRASGVAAALGAEMPTTFGGAATDADCTYAVAAVTIGTLEGPSV